MCSVMRCLFLIMLATVVATGPAHAGAAGPRVIREQLKTEFTLSRIDVRDPRTEGYVVRPGAVLTLRVAGVPAKRLRAIQLNTKSPRFHGRDYAQVEVTADGRVITGPGKFRLAARPCRCWI